MIASRQPLPRLGFAVSLLLLSLVLMTGCATSQPPADWTHRQTTELRQALLSLGASVSDEEAQRVAEAAVHIPIALAEQYRALRPPRLHNYLVNVRLRERGLCYHWANDLFARFNEMAVHSLRFQLVVARMDTAREHNAVVIKAPGQDFKQGIVVDAWRHSGRVWWGRTEKDKYPWQPLPYERVNPTLQQFVAQ